jgi:hypothetical protein
MLYEDVKLGFSNIGISCSHSVSATLVPTMRSGAHLDEKTENVSSRTFVFDILSLIALRAKALRSLSPTLEYKR